MNKEPISVWRILDYIEYSCNNVFVYRAGEVSFKTNALTKTQERTINPYHSPAGYQDRQWFHYAVSSNYQTPWSREHSNYVVQIFMTEVGRHLCLPSNETWFQTDWHICQCLENLSSLFPSLSLALSDPLHPSIYSITLRWIRFQRKGFPHWIASGRGKRRFLGKTFVLRHQINLENSHEHGSDKRPNLADDFMSALFTF